MTSQQLIPIYQCKRATNKERWMNEQIVQMCKTLGVAVPNIGFAYSKKQAKEMGNMKRAPDRGTYSFIDITNSDYYKIVIIMRAHKNLKELKNSIAHELIHYTFPKLQHGDRFEDYYIKSLLSGDMVFDGRGITTKKTE